MGVLGAPHAGSPPQPRWVLWRRFPQGAQARSSPLLPSLPRSLGSPAIWSAESSGEPIILRGGGAGGGGETSRAGLGACAVRARRQRAVTYPPPSPAPPRRAHRPLRHVSLSLARGKAARDPEAPALAAGATRSYRGCAGRERRVPAAAAGRYRGAGRADGQAGSATGSGTGSEGAGLPLGFEGRRRGQRPSRSPGWAAMSRVRPPPGCEGALRCPRAAPGCGGVLPVTAAQGPARLRRSPPADVWERFAGVIAGKGLRPGAVTLLTLPVVPVEHPLQCGPSYIRQNPRVG